MASETPLRIETDRFLKELLEGIPYCYHTGIFFADPRQDDVYISCYRGYVQGMENMHDQIQHVGTNMFTWFMPQVRATKGKPPRELFVISDYDLIPDDAPLKKFYPPSFRSVADYVLWDGDRFVGWIGIVGLKEPIDWDANREFIAKTIEKYRGLLLKAYNEDFMPERKAAELGAAPQEPPKRLVTEQSH